MRIMIGFDCSQQAQKALEKTVELFKPMKPEIILVTVTEEPRDASPESESVFQKWRSERHACMMDTSKIITGSGLNVDAILAVGDPREMLLKATEEKKPDILVIGKRGGGILKGMTLGSVSAYLVRYAKCPVLVVHT